MSRRILVIGSDPDLSAFLRLSLASMGYAVAIMGDRASSLLALHVDAPALAIIDLIRPGPTGMDSLRQARKFETPLLALLPGSDLQTLETALEIGADDYVLAPFRPQELRLRAHALVWRNGAEARKPEKEKAARTTAGIYLDPSALKLTMRGREAKLTASEFLLLSYLVENRGQVMSENDIIAQVWGEGLLNAELLLGFTISRLRARIEPDPAMPRYIVQPEATGYRFEA